jgi:hypothetical protein
MFCEEGRRRKEGNGSWPQIHVHANPLMIPSHLGGSGKGATIWRVFCQMEGKGMREGQIGHEKGTIESGAGTNRPRSKAAKATAVFVWWLVGWLVIVVAF